MQHERPRRTGHCSHDTGKPLDKLAAMAVPTKRVPGAGHVPPVAHGKISIAGPYIKDRFARCAR